ncbi:MAG: hypothetical protein GKR89_36270 [Candidatus Latescibacteria bacterium]|nr:hypothetical protein [Candidatus Latescibacterota bacterium]
MRIGNDKAKAEALKIAEEFLRGMEASNWSWRCVDARPNLQPVVTRFIAILCCLFLLPLSAADLSPKLADQPPSLGPKSGEPWENSLGMKFVPVPGTNVLFCIWETRVQDFEAFVKATSHNASEGWRDPGASGQSYVAGFSQTPLHPVTSVSWNDARHSPGG